MKAKVRQHVVDSLFLTVYRGIERQQSHYESQLGRRVRCIYKICLFFSVVITIEYAQRGAMLCVTALGYRDVVSVDSRR